MDLFKSELCKVKGDSIFAMFLISNGFFYIIVDNQNTVIEIKYEYST